MERSIHDAFAHVARAFEDELIAPLGFAEEDVPSHFARMEGTSPRSPLTPQAPPPTCSPRSRPPSRTASPRANAPSSSPRPSPTTPSSAPRAPRTPTSSPRAPTASSRPTPPCSGTARRATGRPKSRRGSRHGVPRCARTRRSKTLPRSSTVQEQPSRVGASGPKHDTTRTCHALEPLEFTLYMDTDEDVHVGLETHVRHTVGAQNEPTAKVLYTEGYPTYDVDPWNCVVDHSLDADGVTVGKSSRRLEAQPLLHRTYPRPTDR